MKKSLLTLLTAILIGSSFTSCVENTIPDEVVAIYDGQANLLAAQAALLAAEANAANAEAALTAAQTAHEQAKAAALTASTAISQANNAAALAQMAADLAHSIAQNAADLADQQAALAASTAKAAAEAAAAQVELDNMIATNARDAARDAEELAAMIAENNNDNAAAIAALEILIAQNARNAASEEAALAAQIAQEADRAAAAAEALANTIDENAQALAEAQAELANMADLNALELARQEAAIDAILAQAIIDAEMATIALEAAQAAHALSLATTADQIAALDDTLLASYFVNFTTYSALLNTAQTNEVAAQLAILTQIHTMATAVQTDEQAIAGFNNALAVAEATKDGLEAQQAALTASIAVGTTIGDNAATVALLQEEIDANVFLIEALNVKLQAMDADVTAQTNAINAAINDLDIDNLQTKFTDAKGERDGDVTAMATNTNTVETLNAQILAAQNTVDDYDATTATLEGAITTAEAAADAATALVGPANAAETAANAAKTAADDAAQAQAGALTALETAADNAQIDVNAAAAAWLAAQDDLANSTTQLDVDAAEDALEVAQEAYDIARVNFDDQTTDFTWSGGPNGIVGIQPDGPTADVVDTYIVVASVTATGVAPDVTYSATYGEPTTENVTAGGDPMDPEAVDATTETGDYFEYGSDDISTNDLTEFQLATVALDAAKEDLADAIALNIDLAPAVAAAQALYEDKVNLFENAEALLAAQEAVVAAADADATAANTAANAAAAAATAAGNAATTAGTAVGTAATALTTHLGTTVVQYNSNIEDLQVQIAQINISIAAQVIEIASHQASMDALRAQLNAGRPAELIAAEEALAALTILRDAEEANRTILTNSNTFKAATILLINLTERDEVLGLIAGLVAPIATADEAIATAEANIIGFADLTIAQRIALSEQALAVLEAGLVIIQGDVVFYAALTAKYKALVDSLL